MNRRPFDPSELSGSDDVTEQAASSASTAEALAMARELEGLDAGAIRPSDGFTDRVLAAIADEPLPQPMRVAGLAAREGRFGAMLGALRDTWRVAWTGGRPMAARAPAMALVLVLVFAVGSVGSFAAVGAFNALVPQSHETPSPSFVPPSQLTSPDSSFEPTGTPEPSESVGPGETPEASETPEPTETVEPGKTPEATETPEPTETPGDTPRPIRTPQPGDTPKPSDDHGGGGG